MKIKNIQKYSGHNLIICDIDQAKTYYLIWIKFIKLKAKYAMKKLFNICVLNNITKKDCDMMQKKSEELLTHIFQFKIDSEWDNIRNARGSENNQ